MLNHDSSHVRWIDMEVSCERRIADKNPSGGIRGRGDQSEDGHHGEKGHHRKEGERGVGNITAGDGGVDDSLGSIDDIGLHVDILSPDEFRYTVKILLSVFKDRIVLAKRAINELKVGLGLIARVAKEGNYIKPVEFMIINMGGRPGQAICKHLFEHGGLRVTKLWQTKVV
ncbi:hypothetical protein ACH5RR_022676 [Cinchona calisaya]|uniref:Uncharacterized protein n=1 Tax=Cinchona calisaya TaxID=153742 RepID=A0ABD2Z8I5_9GENT